MLVRLPFTMANARQCAWLLNDGAYSTAVVMVFTGFRFLLGVEVV